MRILITSPVFPPDLGGPGVYVPNVGRWLVERGHEVEVVAFCSDPDPQGFPFAVRAITPGFWPLRYMKALLHVFRAARRVDVVYVQEHLAFFHVLAARLAGTPAVIRIMVDGAWEISYRRGWCGGDDHDAFQSKRYGLRVGLVRRLQRTWWRWSSRIICCSDYLRGILMQHYDVAPEKVLRIYNAYNGPKREDFPQTRDEARAVEGLVNSPRILLTVCRLVDWKGVDVIIEAMRSLDDDVHLVVAGDGEMLEPWKQLARDVGLEGRVRFLGNVPHERIPLLIRAADVFVLVSRYEGLSHSLLEVTALGTPIVTSDVCGNPEVVHDGVNGLTVAPRDADGLARSIRRILEDPELADRFVRAGIGRTEEFDRDLGYAQVERVLLEVAGTAQRGAQG